jgi:hypothetical protein
MAEWRGSACKLDGIMKRTSGIFGPEGQQKGNDIRTQRTLVISSSATAKVNWRLTKEKAMSAGQSGRALRAVYIEQWCRVTSLKRCVGFG